MKTRVKGIMPVTKSAKKALRVSLRKMARNLRTKESFKKAVKVAREAPSKSSIVKAYSALDTAAKKGVIHWKKAARLKSRLSKLLKKGKPKQIKKKAKEKRV